MSLSAAKPAATRTTTTSKADVVKQLLNDGWDDDDQLDGVDDTAPPVDTGNGWEEEFSFGDEDDDDANPMAAKLESVTARHAEMKRQNNNYRKKSRNRERRLERNIKHLARKE